MGYSATGLLQRQGAPPLVTGNRVVCLPRDYQGVLAFDRAGGKVAWDAPLVPAEEAVGLAGGTLLVEGAGHLVALDTATGRVRWDRFFEQGICGRPALAGPAVCVALPQGLLRADAATGATIEEKPWDARGPMAALAVRDGRLLGLSEASAVAPARGPAPAPAPAAGPLAVPLREAWRIARPEPDLRMPPPEAGIPGRLLAASRGVLECIEMSPRGGTVWQRFMPPDFEEALWADRQVILAGARRLVALQAETGAPLWQAEAPFRAGLRKVCPPYLVLADRGAEESEGQRLALLDLGSGRLLWDRAIPLAQRLVRPEPVGWDGRNLHLYGDAWVAGARCAVEATVRAADGAVVCLRPLLPADARMLAVVVGDGFGFCLTESGTLYEFSVANGKVVRRPTDFSDLSPRSTVILKLVGPWIQVQESATRGLWVNRQWILRRDDPSYVFRTDHAGEIWGNVFYTVSLRTVVATHLLTKKEVTYEVPADSGAASVSDILDFYPTKDRMWIVSRLASTREPISGGVRFDTFDAASGAHLQTQAMTGIAPGRPGAVRLVDRREREKGEEFPPETVSQFVWTPEALFMTDSRGLYALAAAPPGDTDAGAVQFVAMPPGPVAIDGLLQDWSDEDAVPIRGDAGRQGRLYLAHDPARLYVAVRCHEEWFVPRVGNSDSGGGDRMEIALTTNKDSYRFALGADARGRTVWESLTDAPLPGGLKGAVRYDCGARELVYEAAIPWPDLVTTTGDRRRMGLSIAVWADQPQAGGTVRTLAWGEGLSGRRVVPEANRAIYLYPLAHQAAESIQAVVDELPELPESFEYFMEQALLRAETPEALFGLCGEFLRRHPRSITVGRLLAMDRALCEKGDEEPGKRLADLAAKAGVAEAVWRRYADEAQAYLSQWVYVEAAGYPRGIMLELDDGINPGRRGWDHRVYWNKPAMHSPLAPGWQSDERFPPGEWCEARIPLVLVNLNDVPICGISFGQQGDPRVYWDRSAVVYGGQEEIFLEDDLPAGATTGGSVWEWFDNPVKSGKRSHSHALPQSRYELSWHCAYDFKQPVTAHVREPPGGPYLSQWIYLDPSDTPKTVSLGLYDGHAWRASAIWGEKSRHGRYMGPLPGAGAWHELRLPLEWTPLADEPVAGVSFACDRGRAYWDRTAIVAGGKEQVLVDDDLPPAPAAPVQRMWQPWADTHVGGTALVEGKRGVGLGCDGWSGYAEAPHSAALEPAEMTIEAWVRMGYDSSGPDTRRWLVCKNGHEETDGHYALMVNRNGIGAYLNIGGGTDNKYQAWSPGSLFTHGKWHHAAMTYDGQDLKVYLDGAAAASTHVGKPRTIGTAPLDIGRRQDGYSYFGGTIDEVRMYSRALTADEVRARYDAGGAPPAAEPARSLAAWWGFDDEATPADPSAGWQWVDQPARSGRRAHTQPPADHYAGHLCYLGRPAVFHLPYDPDRTMRVLGRCVPGLGPTEEAWRLLGRMLSLETDPEKRVGLYPWFLRSIPDHPQALDALRAMLDGYRELGRPDPAAAVEDAIRGLKLPDDVLFEYHRRHAAAPRAYLTAWQIIGPFLLPAHQSDETTFPPETEGVRLGATYDGAGATVGWKLVRSDGGYFDLDALMEPHEFVAAYAACWVRSDAAQPAILQVNRDDTCKVWINRELVVQAPSKGAPVRNASAMPIRLAAGWNEVLIRVGNRERDWGFCAELLERRGSGPPPGTDVSTSPPKAP
jgi:hypothetical protein